MFLKVSTDSPALIRRGMTLLALIPLIPSLHQTEIDGCRLSVSCVG
ncbi:MAG: hypothetical protein QNK37_34975 [Acidobacteriota bacterium]|nr:hypothetical protein [Acidobacteriota bacterium]